MKELICKIDHLKFNSLRMDLNFTGSSKTECTKFFTCENVFMAIQDLS